MHISSKRFPFRSQGVNREGLGPALFDHWYRLEVNQIKALDETLQDSELLPQLDAATAWLELGNADKGAELLGEAEALPVDATPFFRGLTAWRRGRVERAAGRLETSAAALDEAERAFGEMSHQAGPFLVAIDRALLRRRQGEPEQALARLEELARHPLAVSRPNLVHELRAAQLETRTELPAGDKDALVEYLKTF